MEANGVDSTQSIAETKGKAIRGYSLTRYNNNNNTTGEGKQRNSQQDQAQEEWLYLHCSGWRGARRL